MWVLGELGKNAHFVQLMRRKGITFYSSRHLQEIPCLLSRYFIVEPGILKYANAPGQPIKETFPLILCSTRFCPGDTLRLEVEHPHGVLYLRMPNGDEKRLWIEALLKAKNIFQQSTNGASSSRPPTLHVSRSLAGSSQLSSSSTAGSFTASELILS